jgi:hypothetical protein
MLPRIDLPELLLEVHAWTGFLDAYVHLADISTRMNHLPTSLVALLISEARNVGLTPVIKAGEDDQRRTFTQVLRLQARYHLAQRSK